VAETSAPIRTLTDERGIPTSPTWRNILSACIVLLCAGGNQRRAPPRRCCSRIICACEMTHDESRKQLREKVHRVNRRLAAAKIEAAFLHLTEDERKAVVGRCELHLSYEELAIMLGESSPQAARAAALRALNRFASEFER